MARRGDGPFGGDRRPVFLCTHRRAAQSGRRPRGRHRHRRSGRAQGCCQGTPASSSTAGRRGGLRHRRGWEHRHEPPPRGPRAAHPSPLLRRKGGGSASGGFRREHGCGSAAHRADGAPHSPPGRLGSPENRRLGLRHREPTLLRQLGDCWCGLLQRAEDLQRLVRRLHPDRCCHQSGQLGRAPDQRRWRGCGHLLGGEQRGAGHRVRHSHQPCA